jgi:thioredoxin 1
MIHRRRPFPTRLAFLCLAPAILASCVVSPHAQAKTKRGIVWRTSFSAALKEAKRLKKPLMVDFSADWCEPCKALHTKVYPVPAVVREARNFVAVRVNATDPETPIVKKYKITTFPHILFLRPDGSVVHSKFGLFTAADFVKAMRTARVKAAKRPAAKA